MGKSVCHVSFSPILSDQRIQRDVRALREAGYTVDEIGFGAGLQPEVMTLASKVADAAGMIPSHVLPSWWAHGVYWRSANVRRLYDRLMSLRPQIIHAHDWEALPAAARAARELDARLIYDSHEAAAVQRLHRLFWRLTFPPHVRALEGHNIHRADAVITVSEGIARYLQKAYGLETRPDVVRSIPEYQAVPFRACDPDNIIVHYHGIFTQGRGLENLVKSVSQWPSRFRLRLTGWGQPRSVTDDLQALARAEGVAERVAFHPGVDYSALIKHASEADIGICFWAGNSAQQRFVLPNKFFEYTMAGMMLCVGPGEEMHRLIEQYGHGLAFCDNTPGRLAAALRELGSEEIDACRKKALDAARELCWEHEKNTLLEIYRNIEPI